MTNDEIFRKLTDGSDAILIKLKTPVKQYCRTRDELMSCDVSVSENYRNNFAQFYRLARRKREWKDHYFTLLEQAKNESTVTFADTLERLKQRTNRIEPSFSSKLVATIDPKQPVIDSVVLGVMGYRQPYAYHPDRSGELNKLYRMLTDRMLGMIQDVRYVELSQRFLTLYPDHLFTDMKILDFMLWQLREPKAVTKNG